MQSRLGRFDESMESDCSESGNDSEGHDDESDRSATETLDNDGRTPDREARSSGTAQAAQADEEESYWEELYDPSPVPSGVLRIVLKPALVERPKYDEGLPVERGVYLSSKEGKFKPPSPVARSNDTLQKAARMCLTAAEKVTGDSTELVTVAKGTPYSTLTIHVADGPSEQQLLYQDPQVSMTADPVPPDDPDFRHGFHQIRVFDAPAMLYSSDPSPMMAVSEIPLG